MYLLGGSWAQLSRLPSLLLRLLTMWWLLLLLVRVPFLFNLTKVFQNFDQHLFLFFNIGLVCVANKLHVNFPMLVPLILLYRFLIKLVEILI